MKHKLARLLSLTLVSATIFGLLAPAALADTTIGTTITVRDGTSANNDTIQVIGLSGGAATFTGSITSVDLTATRTWSLPDAGGTFTLLGNASTGTGSVVLATSPTLVTPVLGVATGTSLALGGGTALTTTNQTGTGSLVLATSPTLVTPVLGAATATTLSVSGALAANGGITFDAATDTVGAHTLAGTLNLATNNITNGGTITATSFVGALTGNASTATSATTAGTVTTAAQPAITSVGTLTALQVDNINIDLNTISSTAGTDLLITPLAGQQIVLDGAIVIDAGVATGATSITSTSFVGALTGNASTATTAGTVTTAAQPAITSVGALTTLTVDDITINGNTISSAGASTLAINPTAGQSITFDGTVTLDAGVIAGATSITSTSFVGALTGNASTATALAANGANCAAGQAPLGVDASGAVEGCTAYLTSALADAFIFVGNVGGVATGVAMSGDVTISNTGATTIGANTVALTTDTTGNYVASANTSALTGLTGGSAGSEGAALSLALDYSATLAADPALAAGATVFGTTGLIFEGATANLLEGLLTVADPTADRTWTLPDASGTVCLTSTCLTSSLTDNVTDALDIQEGTNNYININTTNAAENISFGNATTNPTFTFLGTGVLTVGTVDINGGAIDGTTIGGTVAAAGAFTTLSASGALAANGGITFDAATDTVGAHTLGGTLDAATNILTNIGNAGTDFLANGGLTLANALTVTTGGATIGGHIISTGPTAVDATTGTCSTVTVTGTDTRGTIVATCTTGQTVIVTFGAAYAAAPICVVSPANAEAVTGNSHLVSSTTNMTLTSTAAATAGNWKYHCIE